MNIKNKINNLIRTHANLIINSQLDLQIQLSKRATEQTLDYIEAKMPNALVFPSNEQLMDFSLSKIKPSGSILEFGVYRGRTLRHIAKKLKNRICYGFDSFKGLPEDWSGMDSPKGYFDLQSEIPTDLPNNVKLQIGWFNESIPKFLETNHENIALLHIDSDLYSSAKTIFDLLYNRITEGTIIQFDEYFNYPTWQKHEFKAFQEFVQKYNIEYEYLGFSSKYAVSINIKKIELV